MIIVMGVQMACNRCGYCWSPRTDRPKECPECKSRKWNSEIGGGDAGLRDARVHIPGGVHVSGLPEDRRGRAEDILQAVRGGEEVENGRMCPEGCGRLYENRKLMKYWCKCGYQEPMRVA